MTRTFMISLALALAAFPLCSLRAADISQGHVHELASDYFVHYFQIGCGGVGVPTLRGDHWEAPVHLGVAGTLSGYIDVDARTGQVSYGRPSAKFPVASAASLEAWEAELKKRAHETASKKRPRKT